MAAVWVVTRTNGSAAGAACSETHAHAAALWLGATYRESDATPAACLWCLWCGEELTRGCGGPWPGHSLAVSEVVATLVRSGRGPGEVDAGATRAEQIGAALGWQPDAVVAAVRRRMNEDEEF